MKSSIEIQVKNNKIDIVNYLKGFSIFTIFLMHLIRGYMRALPDSIRFLSLLGGTGVHVFFLCSGIGLYVSYMTHKTSYCEFIKNRFLKIYVPYVIVVLIAFCLPYTYEGDNRFVALMSHVFLFKMFVPEFIESFSGQLWFVSTIFQFYFLFIPICKIKEKIDNTKIFLTISLTISVIWWIIVYALELGQVRPVCSFCFQYMWEFVLGICIAELLVKKQKIQLKVSYVLIIAIIGLGLQGIMKIFFNSFDIFNDIPALFGYTSFALILSKIPIIKKIFAKISFFSYELYLVHTLIFLTFFNFLPSDNLLYQFVVGIVASIVNIAIAYLYHRIIVELTKKDWYFMCIGSEKRKY